MCERPRSSRIIHCASSIAPRCRPAELPRLGEKDKPHLCDQRPGAMFVLTREVKRPTDVTPGSRPAQNGEHSSAKKLDGIFRYFSGLRGSLDPLCKEGPPWTKTCLE